MPEIDQSSDAVMNARVAYAVRTVMAASQELVPWRASNDPLPQEDRDWCTAVCNSVLEKKKRPSHPNTDIEQLLQHIDPTNDRKGLLTRLLTRLMPSPNQQ